MTTQERNRAFRRDNTSRDRRHQAGRDDLATRHSRYDRIQAALTCDLRQLEQNLADYVRGLSDV